MHLFCVFDLKELGLDPERIPHQGNGTLRLGQWLSQPAYDVCTIENLIGVLGVAMATEGLGADLATPDASILEKDDGIPDGATTFLRSHGLLMYAMSRRSCQGVNDLPLDKEEVE